MSRLHHTVFKPRIRAILSAGMLLASCAFGAPGAEVAKGIQIKAAFLYNFTKFVEWPPESFSAPDSAIVIGVLGEGPFGEELEKVVRGRRVNGRPIAILALPAAGDAGVVHVLFVPDGAEARFDGETAAGVLTVGDSDRFAALGGMITFVPEADKVRFIINLEAAERAGLKVSAQLLKLATKVHRKS